MSDAAIVRTSEADAEGFVFAFTFPLPAATTIVIHSPLNNCVRKIANWGVEVSPNGDALD
jgi:hypothetical protein